MNTVTKEVTYDDDIIDQLRRAALFSMVAGNRRMLENAADEIARLRLTEEDRAAIEEAEQCLIQMSTEQARLEILDDMPPHASVNRLLVASTLRGLLERKK